LSIHSSKRRKPFFALRIFAACLLLLPWLYLAGQIEHAGAKGPPISPNALLPITLVALTMGIVGKRWLNSISGLFLAGLGGAIGAPALASQYGGVMGLVIGIAVTVLPWYHKPHQSPGNRRST
jgi:hypothetical protein